MARIKLSEVRAKTLVYKALEEEYQGISFDLLNDGDEKIAHFFANYKAAVVKVDQAIKKRNKLGLVVVGVTEETVRSILSKYKLGGYRWVLLEPLIEHIESDERFISFELTADGIDVLYSRQGGVSVEDTHHLVEKYTINNGKLPKELAAEGFTAEIFEKVIAMFENSYCTNLEINPLVIKNGTWFVLDAAMQVDSSADFFVDDWSLDDERVALTKQHQAEIYVEALASKSPASLSLKVLNEQGDIFLLLSGGGASVVILDEFAARGVIKGVANYGEYSGNPNRHETYRYTKAVLELMNASSAASKVLFIAGGVANFTDIAKTFEGIIDAFEECVDSLKDPAIFVVVRRGGPNDRAGLDRIKKYMQDKGIRHVVYGADTTITQAVANVVTHVGGSND